MKYLKTFETYTEVLNEAGIFDFLKKLFNMMFQGIDKIYTEQTQRVFKDIENKRKPKEVFDILKRFIIISKENFTKDLENVSDLIKLRDASYSNIISLYSAFTTASKKLSNTKISFSEIFGDNPPKGFKKIFDQKDDKKRIEYIKGFTDSLIENLGSDLNIENFSILKNPIGFKENEKDANVSGETSKNEVTQDQINNLRDILKQWFDSNIYNKITKNIGEISKESLNVNADDLDEIVNNIKNTKNKEGVKKILQAIANLEDPKKYAAVRDKLSELGIIDENDINTF
jgi:uncharacterized protein YbcV (DUF1398 family)